MTSSKTSLKMLKPSECPLCGGLERRRVIAKHPISGLRVVKMVPCVCYISRVVSEENRLFAGITDQYIEQVAPTLDISRNFLIRGPYAGFLLNMKALLMRYRFVDPRPRILFCRSIDIVHDYYVQQADGTCPHLSTLQNIDLVVLVFGNNEHNQRLSSCLLQVFSMRDQNRKPIWVYLPENRPTLASCEQEYSPELEGYMEKFEQIVLGSLTGNGRPKNQNKMANFQVG